MAERIAVVTGGNRGIGLAICRRLVQEGVDVVLTARDAAAGQKTADEVGARFAQLDVTDRVNVDAFARDLGPLDILVNNAGVAMDGFDGDVARHTMDVNFYGAMRVTDAVLPAMRDGGRIVMVSSGMGTLDRLGDELRAQFTDPMLTRAQLAQMVEQFVSDVRAEQHGKRGWPSNAYTVSKVALNALTRVLGRELEELKRRIKVNAGCPGWVRTRMGGEGASRSPEEGADTPVWLALLPEDGPSGGFFRDRQPIDW